MVMQDEGVPLFMIALAAAAIVGVFIITGAIIGAVLLVVL
jgi:hypothetical protein